MGIFNRNKIVTKYKLVSDIGNGFYAFDGNVYKSDIVRACIRPKIKAIGKLIPKHIYTAVQKDGTTKIEVNPDAYIRFLLEDPNPYMSGQKLQEKVAAQLCLNSNAFILIIRDDNGLPYQLYPIPATYVEALYDSFGELHLRFTFNNGSTYQFYYTDIIHLREDYYENDIFGTSKIPALLPLMEIVTTTDQGIVKAIKNSGVIRWLLKYHSATRPEDMKKNAEEFSKNFLDIENGGKGVAAVDSKADATQIQPHDYVPNSTQMEKTTERIYSFFNTNKNIVQSKWTEDEWNSYYEAEIEPVVCDLSSEYTRKLFTRRERAFGNKIMFEASNLQFASVSTKLQFKPYIDIGAMLRNEWRAIMNLAPLPDGDVPLLRKDTGTIEESSEGVSE